MLDESMAAPCCPACGVADAVPLGILPSGEPRNRLDERESQRENMRFVERTYGCRSCGEVFSTGHLPRAVR